MPWTYAALRGALAALGTLPDVAATVAALNAQTVTVDGQAFTLHPAKIVALTSANFSWAKIAQRAQQTAAIPPVTATDGAILAARTITSMSDTQTIDPSVPGSWAAWLGGLAALQAVGDLSAADVAAINALPTVTGPAWVPAVTAGDVQTAEAQP